MREGLARKKPGSEETGRSCSGSSDTDREPADPLAAVQAVWDRVVGARIAAVTEVVEEREGVVTVACSSAVWAQELELMAPRITASLREELGASGPEKLRFRTAYLTRKCNRFPDETVKVVLFAGLFWLWQAG